MPKYIIPVSWTVSAEMEIEAKSLSEAIDIAFDDAELPTKSEYVDDSFEVNVELAEELNK